MSVLTVDRDDDDAVAKAFGATVIATASTPRKLDIAKAFGADHVVSYNDADWPAKVKALNLATTAAATPAA